MDAIHAVGVIPCRALRGFHAPLRGDSMQGLGAMRAQALIFIGRFARGEKHLIASSTAKFIFILQCI
jgi:hypothetical protein